MQLRGGAPEASRQSPVSATKARRAAAPPGDGPATPATAARAPVAGGPPDGLSALLARAVQDRACGARGTIGGPLLQRKFWERTADDSYVWHAEDPDGRYRQVLDVSGQGVRYSRWHDIFSYDVYEAAPAAEKPKRKRKPKKTKPKPSPTPVIESASDEVDDDSVEAEDDVSFVWINGKRVVVLRPSASSVTTSTGSGAWELVESESAIKEKKALEVDIDALADEIDDHEGSPGAIRERFNTLFNALVAQGEAQEGTILNAYRAKSDRPAGFSVAVTLPPLRNWVLHAHCKPDGAIAVGENATHYKRTSQEGALGVSIALLPKQIAALLPPQDERLDWARTHKPHLKL